MESSLPSKRVLSAHADVPRYSRYVANISREDLQRLTPTRAPTRTGADDLSAPGLSPIEVHH